MGLISQIGRAWLNHRQHPGATLRSTPLTIVWRKTASGAKKYKQKAFGANGLMCDE